MLKMTKSLDMLSFRRKNSNDEVVGFSIDGNSDGDNSKKYYCKK